MVTKKNSLTIERNQIKQEHLKKVTQDSVIRKHSIGITANWKVKQCVKINLSMGINYDISVIQHLMLIFVFLQTNIESLKIHRCIYLKNNIIAIFKVSSWPTKMVLQHR